MVNNNALYINVSVSQVIPQEMTFLNETKLNENQYFNEHIYKMRRLYYIITKVPLLL